MKKINVNGTEYKIKFGYLAVSSSNLLGETLNMITRVENMLSKKEEEEDNEEIDDLTSMQLMSDVIPLVGKMTLAGLQRYHEDVFGVDYEDEADVRKKLKSVLELLDEYFDPEEGEPEESAIEMFWDYVNEFRGSGFLSGKATETEAVQQTLPIEPQDHKKAQK